MPSTALRFGLATCCQNRPGVEGWPPNWSGDLLAGVERRHPLPHWQVELTQTIRHPCGCWKRTGSVLSKLTPERPKTIDCIDYDCDSDPCTLGTFPARITSTTGHALTIHCLAPQVPQWRRDSPIGGMNNHPGTPANANFQGPLASSGFRAPPHRNYRRKPLPEFP